MQFNLSPWCVDLPGDPAWWQAVAGLAQAIFAYSLLKATKRTVDLTQRLAESQQELVNLENRAAKRQLYERRLRVFLATMEFLASFARDLKMEMAYVQKLLRETLEAEFLFDAKVEAFLGELRKKAGEYYVCEKLFQDIRELPRKQQHLENMHALQDWFVETASTRANMLFAPYLNLTQGDLEPIISQPQSDGR